MAFDIDGTLYPNWKMYLRSFPFALKNYRLIKAFSRVRKQLRTIDPIHDFQKLQAGLLSEAMDISYDEAYTRIHTILYRDWEKVLARVPLYPGALECIEDIRKRGLKTAVASDFPVERKLGILGIEGLWDYELSTEDTNYLKPHKKPFEAIIQSLGVPAEEILYVGNSYAYDVLGARAVGMKTAHITTKSVPNTMADFTFSHYKQLHTYLFR